ncbi:T9SS type A sorting domain-containing protein [candidate division WOR-3 bacterium]|nr:T9SS type A sorting domain-containing protein [candidate division WOR-3 bacterium]
MIKGRLTVCDAAGNVVREEALERGETERAVSLSGMRPGVYFVVLEDGSGQMTAKFVLLR